MTTWQIVDCSIRRISFKNSIWRAGGLRRFRFVEDEDALLLAALFEEPTAAAAISASRNEFLLKFNNAALHNLRRWRRICMGPYFHGA
jgi:hypothetical protein